MSRKKAISIIAYLSFLLISYIYVKNVLKKEEIQIYKEEEERTVQKEYPVMASLKLYQNGDVEEYKLTTTSQESVEEFFEDLRGDEEIIYEITRYTYGNEITSVFGKPAPEGYKWALLLDGDDITLKMGDINVDKNQVYELRMIKE